MARRTCIHACTSRGKSPRIEHLFASGCWRPHPQPITLQRAPLTPLPLLISQPSIITSPVLYSAPIGRQRTAPSSAADGVVDGRSRRSLTHWPSPIASISLGPWALGPLASCSAHLLDQWEPHARCGARLLTAVVRQDTLCPCHDAPRHQPCRHGQLPSWTNHQNRHFAPSSVFHCMLTRRLRALRTRPNASWANGKN